ncbi:FecR family protein [Chitinophaga sp. YR573]|uniref:FecR family protein n=1 Tax=Chitinophaga sp. YR573 TaxID=1881040 RepID=UPI0008B118C1|nr:FecR family protein [Chitinophaga sp. YR573]SEW00832.1 FecR family protein [Chitinophaga sp. YR573]
MNNEHLKYLLDQWLEKKSTAAEENELAAYLEQHPDNEVLPELLQHFLDNTAPDNVPSLKDRERRLSAILQMDKTANSEQSIIRPMTPTPLRVTFLRRWGWIAASVLLLLATGTFVLRSLNTSHPAQPPQDITPGGNKAILTLGDGSTVTLDSANRLIRQGIRQTGGQLVYDAQSTAISYNTLTTPRGGQFQVRLPDGTMVWLNAASSLRYPTTFTGGERRVEISGEAYFEVVKDPRQPFKVKIGEQGEVEVLGTHFNVDAYPDESSINTTLLEGAVRVNNKVVLKPGQQAQAANNSIKTINNANIAKVMAWKNGLFNFEDASLREVMQQLARWYDLQIVYEQNVPDMYFEGEMSRDMNLSQVLDGLQKTGVRFRIEAGKRLVVLKQ